MAWMCHNIVPGTSGRACWWWVVGERSKGTDANLISIERLALDTRSNLAAILNLPGSEGPSTYGSPTAAGMAYYGSDL